VTPFAGSVCHPAEHMCVWITPKPRCWMSNDTTQGRVWRVSAAGRIKRYSYSSVGSERALMNGPVLMRGLVGVCRSRLGHGVGPPSLQSGASDPHKLWTITGGSPQLALTLGITIVGNRTPGAGASPTVLLWIVLAVITLGVWR
jgi:hypothetical protein